VCLSTKKLAEVGNTFYTGGLLRHIVPYE